MAGKMLLISAYKMLLETIFIVKGAIKIKLN